MSTSANTNYISIYTRKQAIEDGVLVDLSAQYPEVVKAAGLRWNLALTHTAYAQTIDAQDRAWRSKRDRAWDVAYMLVDAIRRCRDRDARVLVYSIDVYDSYLELSLPVFLKAVFGPDDDGNPCITVMLPEED